MTFLHASDQHVQIWLGGKKIAEYDLKDADAELMIPISTTALGNGTPVILGFYLPDAKTETNDPRALALYIKSLRLMR